MKEHGYQLVTSLESDRVLDEHATVQCVHCGGHFPVRPGSGTVRGYCMNCAGFVCGPGCAACVPVEQLLDNMERGLPLDFRPIIAAANYRHEIESVDQQVAADEGGGETFCEYIAEDVRRLLVEDAPVLVVQGDDGIHGSPSGGVDGQAIIAPGSADGP